MHLNSIDRAKPQKLYYQLLEILKEHIRKSEWKVGAQIPTEEQLALRYNVSKATVRMAVEELVSLGYLKKLQGRGTFVRRNKPANSIIMITDLAEDCMLREAAFIARLIESRIFQPEDAVRHALDLCEDDHCSFFSRHIIAEGNPLLIQKLYIPYHLPQRPASPGDISEISPCAFFETLYGTAIQRVKEITDIAQIAGKEAGLLELTSDACVLRVRQISYAQGDTPVGFFESLYRKDRYAKVREFERLKI